ncbi:MarR family winged helix-turn-helix transcriptional regulator [Nocardia inohanensis]|uniref:MarR family winged helix-turn-helix transcriptional regulator n=1 Tax=Nocardia inohanensis TaxID=209246 RepID=UPI000A048020|nr:MarR family transcriptional regulator [Nocardia inohanensis]
MTEDREYHPRGLLRFPTYALGKLHKKLHNEIDSNLREHWVLTYLAEQGEISQQTMADAMEIDRSEVVRLVDSLEKAGLVSRQRDPADRRKNCLVITAAGNRVRAETDAKVAATTEVLLHRLTPAERAQLHELSLKALGYELGDLEP